MTRRWTRSGHVPPAEGRGDARSLRRAGGHQSVWSVAYVSGIDGVTASAVNVSLGYYHSCAVMDDGSIKCWGRGSYGQLGTGNGTTSYVPVDVIDIDGSTFSAEQVSLGIYHACARLDTGDIACWGYGYYGQRGVGSRNSASIPELISF